MAEEKKGEKPEKAVESAQEKREVKEKTVETTAPELSEISIVLDTYDDIFSDFDPRPFSERALSVDLLVEMRRRKVESRKGKKVEVRFLIPAKMRDTKIEAVIRKRLREYFRGELKEAEGKAKARRMKGLAFIAGGAALLLAVGYAYTKMEPSSIVTVAEILLTPPGWFSMWVGLEKVVEEQEELKSIREMSRKFSEGEFIFISTEEGSGKPLQTRLF